MSTLVDRFIGWSKRTEFLYRLSLKNSMTHRFAFRKYCELNNRVLSQFSFFYPWILFYVIEATTCALKDCLVSERYQFGNACKINKLLTPRKACSQIKTLTSSHITFHLLNLFVLFDYFVFYLRTLGWRWS